MVSVTSSSRDDRKAPRSLLRMCPRVPCVAAVYPRHWTRAEVHRCRGNALHRGDLGRGWRPRLLPTLLPYCRAALRSPTELISQQCCSGFVSEMRSVVGARGAESPHRPWKSVKAGQRALECWLFAKFCH
ncbi:uncharacterized protein [Oryctolagus cuniculus]|uniref:uncharacterized protein isoform X2 n=1 Tax=Oryctolagus cuniculus TaxID=9986 RepID=UPI00387A4F85